MKKLFGILYFMLSNQNKIQLIWCGAVLLAFILLLILHRVWRDDCDRLELWKKLCIVPFLITTVHYFIYVSGASGFLRDYTPMYLIALFAFVLRLCEWLDKGYRLFSSVTCVLAVAFGLHFCISVGEVHNYARKSYTASFSAMARELDRSYVSKEWKEIDFKALEEKYMPLVEKAAQEKDPAHFADAVEMFCNELHDGHVDLRVDYDHRKYSSVMKLHDHGLSMIRLDSGEVIAVCTEPEVNALGIEDGTVITKWNGKPVLQAAAEDVPDFGYPVKANADRLAFIELSAMGGDTAEVTFINVTGSEKTVTLPSREDEHTLDEAYDLFSHSPESRSKLYSSNFSTKMLDDKCGYIMLTVETSGNTVRDTIASYTGESGWAKEMFRKKLRELKEQGMEYLVIDMRNNMGGFGEIGYALVSLLSDEDIYAQSFGTRRNGEYVSITDNFIRADGEFAGLKAVALTNYNCVSAGDSMAKCLSKLPNVTLAGMTDPNGSAQMTGGCCVLSEGIVSVNYPVLLTLNEKGEPDIDPRADRISRDPVEVRIPLDREAAMKIFRDKEDYELEWAVARLRAPA